MIYSLVVFIYVVRVWFRHMFSFCETESASSSHVFIMLIYNLILFYFTHIQCTLPLQKRGDENKYGFND